MTKIQAVVGLVRAFWKDNRFPYFLVTLAPYDRDHCSSDGAPSPMLLDGLSLVASSLNGLLAQSCLTSPFMLADPMRMGLFRLAMTEADIKWFRDRSN